MASTEPSIFEWLTASDASLCSPPPWWPWPLPRACGAPPPVMPEPVLSSGGGAGGVAATMGISMESALARAAARAGAGALGGGGGGGGGSEVGHVEGVGWGGGRGRLAPRAGRPRPAARDVGRAGSARAPRRAGAHQRGGGERVEAAAQAAHL